jgi:hypothetical protein
MIRDRLFLTSAPQALSAGDVVYIADGVHAYYRRVREIRQTRVQLDIDLDGGLRLDSAYVSRARLVSVTSVAGRTIASTGTALFSFRVAGDLSSFGPPTLIADVVEQGAQPVLERFEVQTAKYLPPNPGDPLSGFTTFTVFDPNQVLVNPQAMYFPPAAQEWRVDTFLFKSPDGLLPHTITAALPKAASNGDFIVMASGDQLAWSQLSNIGTDSENGQAQLTVPFWRKRASGRFYLGRTRIYAHFKQQARLQDWNGNTSAVIGASLPIPEASRPKLLVVGRRLWLENPAAAREAVVTDLTADAVLVDPPLTIEEGFTVGNLVIRGNIVTAGHGEAQNERILGSGVASALNQSFVLEVAGVSFVADATFPAGVRADIDVLVDGQIWRQVGALEDFSTADPLYALRMTEAGFLRIDFGDGVHGRRLPSGNSNVRVRYRLGTGLAGNIPAGVLEAPLRPHPLVDKVRQPVNASGGGDMESRDALKRNAPASVLTLERAVSAVDFAHLAAAHAAVWDARAFGSPGARQRERVEVVVVPAGGIALDARLQAALEDFLQSHSAPGVAVVVSEFSRVWLHLDITLRIVSREVDREAVKAQTIAQLRDAFALQRRAIGAPVYLSDVFAVVESVPGVQNSVCRLGFERGGVSGTAEQQITAAQREVIFLDLIARPGALRLQIEEFEL